MLYKGLIAGLLGLVLVGCGGEPTADTKQNTSGESETSNTEMSAENTTQNEAKEQVSDETTVQDKTFGITPREFGQRISAEVKEAGLGEYNIGDFNIREGKVNDGFTEVLSDAIAMNGTVDKNGELKAVTFIMGQTNEAEKEVMSLAMMAGLTARALSPALPKEETAGEVVQLITKSVGDFSETGEGDNSIVVDNIKYTASISKELGLWVYFEPAE